MESSNVVLSATLALAATELLGSRIDNKHACELRSEVEHLHMVLKTVQDTVVWALINSYVDCDFETLKDLLGQCENYVRRMRRRLMRRDTV